MIRQYFFTNYSLKYYVKLCIDHQTQFAMKIFFIFALTVFFSLSLQAQDTIKYTSFEGDSLSWKGKGIGSGLLSDPLSPLQGSTSKGPLDFPPNQRVLSGNRSWQISSTRDTIIMDSVVVAFYDSVRLKLRFSGTATTAIQGLDFDDSLKIFVAVNGNSFSLVPQIIISSPMPFIGEANSKWGFNADSIINAPFDTTLTYITPSGVADTTTSSSTAIINFFKPGVTSIKVMIIAFTTNTLENWNIDDLILLGKKTKALAIKGMAFNVHAQKEGVMLHWSNVDESDCLQYTIQRSPDFNSFINIKTLDCLNKENDVHSYSYPDLGSSPGWNYYRIKLNFLDGSCDYSEIKSIYRNNTSAFKVYPTLVLDVLQVSAPGISDYKYVIVDMNGKTYQVKKNTTDTKSINVNQLPSGVYFILLTCGTTSETFKFIRI
jgi:Secretion system C-terminal sorting domain